MHLTMSGTSWEIAELTEAATIRKFRIVQIEVNRQVSRKWAGQNGRRAFLFI